MLDALSGALITSVTQGLWIWVSRKGSVIKDCHLHYQSFYLLYSTAWASLSNFQPTQYLPQHNDEQRTCYNPVKPVHALASLSTSAEDAVSSWHCLNSLLWKHLFIKFRWAYSLCIGLQQLVGWTIYYCSRLSAVPKENDSALPPTLASLAMQRLWPMK